MRKCVLRITNELSGMNVTIYGTVLRDIDILVLYVFWKLLHKTRITSPMQ